MSAALYPALECFATSSEPQSRSSVGQRLEFACRPRWFLYWIGKLSVLGFRSGLFCGAFLVFGRRGPFGRRTNPLLSKADVLPSIVSSAPLIAVLLLYSAPRLPLPFSEMGLFCRALLLFRGPLILWPMKKPTSFRNGLVLC